MVMACSKVLSHHVGPSEQSRSANHSTLIFSQKFSEYRPMSNHDACLKYWYCVCVQMGAIYLRTSCQEGIRSL
jgi:hypothetical protein